jgi:hypothetical protein
MRSILIIFGLMLATGAASRAAGCPSKPQVLPHVGILATMTYYAKPGKEAAIYNGLIAQDTLLTTHHIQTPMLYRGPGGDGPAAMWVITFPSWAAHDAWLKSADAVPESASDKANDKTVEAATRRMEHRHYVLHDGWAVNSCPA